MTVVATYRQQGRNVPEYLTSRLEMQLAGPATPSLRPEDEPEINAA